jgi:outer membrane immunogenic protein
MTSAIKSLLTGSLALALLAGLWGLADDARAAPPPPVYDWSGWYAGASFGYGFGQDDITISPVSPGSFLRIGFVSPQLGVSPQGVLGGVQVGKNWQSGNFVYGFETDFSRSGIRGDVVGPVTTFFQFRTTHSQTLDWFGTLRARAGFALMERTLIYATGGLAYGRAGLSSISLSLLRNACGNTIDFCAIGDSKQWKAGWTVGTGFEYAVSSNWSAKLEYLYYDLGTVTNAMTDILINPDEFRGAGAVKGNIVRVGVNYRFGMVR